MQVVLPKSLSGSCGLILLVALACASWQPAAAASLAVEGSPDVMPTVRSLARLTQAAAAALQYVEAVTSGRLEFV